VQPNNLSNRALGAIAGTFLALSVVAAIGIPRLRNKPRPTPPATVPADFSVRLERIPGVHNIVPRYTVELRPDGSFLVNAEAGGSGMAAQTHAKQVGGQLPPEAVHALFSIAFSEELFALSSRLPCDRYTAGSDRVEVRVTMDGMSKDFAHDLGCEAVDPEPLTKLARFEVALEQLTKSPICRFVPAYCQLR
jgi:hypothetical protein